MTWQRGARGSGSRPRPEGPGQAGRGALPPGPVGPRGPGTAARPSLPQVADGESSLGGGEGPLVLQLTPCAPPLPPGRWDEGHAAREAARRHLEVEREAQRRAVIAASQALQR